MCTLPYGARDTGRTMVGFRPKARRRLLFGSSPLFVRMVPLLEDVLRPEAPPEKESNPEDQRNQDQVVDRNAHARSTFWI